MAELHKQGVIATWRNNNLFVLERGIYNKTDNDYGLE